ncbi:hypothetical protein V8C34DRAFT_204834 [Trichoderma compactum]
MNFLNCMRRVCFLKGSRTLHIPAAALVLLLVYRWHLTFCLAIIRYDFMSETGEARKNMDFFLVYPRRPIQFSFKSTCMNDACVVLHCFFMVIMFLVPDA